MQTVSMLQEITLDRVDTYNIDHFEGKLGVSEG